jgi:hypothetical protein
LNKWQLLLSLPRPRPPSQLLHQPSHCPTKVTNRIKKV